MTSQPRVHNKRAGTAPADAIYVGRGSPWGNPYELGKDGSREECIEKFRRFVLPKLDVRPLIGKHLVCYCAPLPCHADLLLLAARALEDPHLRLDFSKAPKTPDARQGCVATAADGRGRMLSKTTSESAEKAHFEHWCMAEGCHCWGDFGLPLDDRSRKLLAQNTVAGASSAASLPRRVWLCAAHRAQYLQAREQSACRRSPAPTHCTAMCESDSKNSQKQKEQAKRLPLPVKDEPDQGGLF